MADQSGEPYGALRLREWAIDPDGGGRIFAWLSADPEDLDRARVFFAGKVPDGQLDTWCDELRVDAAARVLGAPATAA